MKSGLNPSLSDTMNRYLLYIVLHSIIVIMNSSLYSCMLHKQDKEMDNQNLFIDYHYKSIVSTIRERHVLTLHLSTANCRRKLTTSSCCKNVDACCTHYVIPPDRVIPHFLELWPILMHFNGTLTLLYFIEMLPCMVLMPNGKI